MSNSPSVQKAVREICEDLNFLSDDEFDRELKYSHNYTFGEHHVHSPEFLRET